MKDALRRRPTRHRIPVSGRTGRRRQKRFADTPDGSAKSSGELDAVPNTLQIGRRRPDALDGFFEPVEPMLDAEDFDPHRLGCLVDALAAFGSVVALLGKDRERGDDSFEMLLEADLPLGNGFSCHSPPFRSDEDDDCCADRREGKRIRDEDDQERVAGHGAHRQSRCPRRLCASTSAALASDMAAISAWDGR